MQSHQRAVVEGVWAKAQRLDGNQLYEICKTIEHQVRSSKVGKEIGKGREYNVERVDLMQKEEEEIILVYKTNI